ncbi:MAG: hypothetical protein Q9218_002260 [Villophora microphyllina]
MPVIKDQQLVKSFQHMIVGMVASVAEAHVCSAAVQANPYVVRAFEGGVVDLALCTGSKLHEDSSSDRTLKTLESAGQGNSQKNFIAIDVKNFSPLMDQGTNLCWTFGLSEAQRQHCQLFILHSAKDPDYVAVLPKYYLDLDTFETEIITENTGDAGKTSQKVTLVHFYSFRALWTHTRENVHTGVVFDVPRESLAMVGAEKLKPDLPTWLRALKDIQFIEERLRQGSSRFRVQLTEIFPLSGDCTFLDSKTGEKVFVELKSAYCRIKHGLQPAIEHRQQVFWTRRGSKSLYHPIFSWKAQWDFLYTMTASRTEVLLIPRDRIPDSWWNRLARDDEWFEWPLESSAQALEDFSVALGSPDRFVADIERILLCSATNGKSMRAQIPIAVVPPPSVEALEAILDNDGSLEHGIAREAYWSSSYRRGFGTAEHGAPRKSACQNWAAEALMEMCRRNGNLQYEWSAEDKAYYDAESEPPRRVWDFPCNTPVVPIDFMNAEFRGNHLPVTHNGLHRFTDVAQDRSLPSLIIGDLFPQSAVRLRHTRVVFPSRDLPDDGPYTGGNDDRKFRPWVTTGMLDQYHIDEDKVLDEIMKVFSNADEVSIGSGGLKLETKEHCYLLKDALPGGLTIITKEGLKPAPIGGSGGIS